MVKLFQHIKPGNLLQFQENCTFQFDKNYIVFVKGDLLVVLNVGNIQNDHEGESYIDEIKILFKGQIYKKLCLYKHHNIVSKTELVA